MIEASQIDSMSEFLEKEGVTEENISKLRAQYQGIHMNWAMDDDINSTKPFAEREGFNVYLVDSRDHCSCLTIDPEVASGLVFAECFDDE